MELEIKGRKIKLRYSFRSFILYENIQGKSFQPSSTTEVLVFLYCCILASDRDLDFTFDEFLDMVDDKPQIIVEFSEFLTSQLNKTKTLTPEEEKEYDEEGNEVKKK